MTLEDLEARRAAIPDDDALPASTTRGELAAIQQQRQLLDRRIKAARSATATLAALRDPDPVWWNHLKTWRQTLVAELMTPIPRPTPTDTAVRRNLTLSLIVIDRGPGAGELANSTYDLTTLRLGQLMREAGFAPQGADPARNFGGVMPWFGSLHDLERQAKDVARRRQQAQAALDAALLDDAERERQEAEAKTLRDAYNALRVKVGADGASLRVVGPNNADVDEATLTPLQRQALAQARAAFRVEADNVAQPVSTESVSTEAVST